jgi:hypothetical protein
MGFLLTLLVVSLIVIGLSRLESKDSAVFGALVCAVVGGLIVTVIVVISTFNYYELHSRLGKHEAYQQTVAVYVAKATPAVGAGPNISVSGNEVTDFKYQSYQGELSDLLQEVRYNATEYNENLAGKRAMALSWYWRLLIVEPDDWMKPLTIE